jgi:hypothetical protein
MNKQENKLNESINEKVNVFYGNEEIKKLINNLIDNNNNNLRIELDILKVKKVEVLLLEFGNESHKEIARIYFNNLFDSDFINLNNL